MNTKLRGIIPPLVTPLLDHDKLDIQGLEQLIEHVVSGGVHGIFILGTTGEGPNLSFKLQTEMIQESSRILNGRVPLLVGISHTSIIDSIRLAHIAYESGADAVVSAPPYYFKPTQSELIDFYRILIPQLKLPLYLYNMPGMTKVSFAPSTVKEIAENEKVIGFKDSSADGTYFQSVLYEMRNRKNFSFFVGPEEMMTEAVLMGADGGVNGGANLFPRLYVDLFNAASTGKIEETRKLHKEVMQISGTIYNIDGHDSNFLTGLKCALSVLGICNDFMAAPSKSYGAEERKKIAKAIEEIQISHLNTFNKK